MPLLGGLVTETVTSDLDSRQWLGNWAVQRGAESTYDPRHYPSPAFDRRERCCNRAVCKSPVVASIGIDSVLTTFSTNPD